MHTLILIVMIEIKFTSNVKSSRCDDYNTYFLGGAGAGYTSSSVWLLIHSVFIVLIQMLFEVRPKDVDLLQLAYAVET